MEVAEYPKMAAVEDTMWYYRALHRQVARVLKKKFPDGAPRLLDAGCGTGGLIRHLRAALPGWRIEGLDFSGAACELARARTDVPVTTGRVQALPFAAETFDAIVSCDVLCQIEDPAVALGEFRRCLRPGGLAVLTLPAYAWLYSYHDRAVGNLRRYRRGEACAQLRAAGFEICFGSYWNVLPFPLVVVRRKIFPPAAAASDVHAFPAPVEAGFNFLMALEHAWFAAGGTFAAGNSILVVGRKPAAVPLSS